MSSVCEKLEEMDIAIIRSEVRIDLKACSLFIKGRIVET
jgi:hypothetical protein